MKLIAFVLALILGLAVCEATAGNCPRVCTRQYDPICASLQRGKSTIQCTFSNRCVMSARKCTNPREQWRVVQTGECGRQSSACNSLIKN